jgi:hypothetical protein
MHAMPMTLSRSLLVILIPGIVALAPWFLLYLHFFAPVDSCQRPAGLDRYPVFENAMAFACVVLAGAFCEGNGTRLENYFDQLREDEFEVDKNWYIYLCRVLEHEPVAYRYIARLVTAMYFELSMLTAVVLFSIGSAWYAWFIPSWMHWVTFAIIFVSTWLLWFLFRNVQEFHLTLCETRQRINEEIG